MTSLFLPSADLFAELNRLHHAMDQVFGTAEVQEGDVREGTLDLIRKYETTEEAALQHWEDIKEDRVLIVVTPERFQWRYDE